MSAVVLTRNSEKNDEKTVSNSLFHPRAFEHEVCEYLTDYYAHKYDKNQADWLAPVNWRPVTGLSVLDARFDVAPIHMPNARQHYCVFPITDNHFLTIRFTVSNIVQASNIQNSQCEFAHVGQERFCIDNAPVLALMENIIQSITVTLSPKNQQACNKVKAENPNLKMAVSYTLASLKWPVKQSLGIKFIAQNL